MALAHRTARVAGGTWLRSLAALAAVVVALAFVLYGTEELLPLPRDLPPERRPCLLCLYARAGTSLLHGLTMLLAATITFAADEWHEDRRGAFYTVLGTSAVLLLLCTPFAMRCRRPAARVQPMTAQAHPAARPPLP